MGNGAPAGASSSESHTTEVHTNVHEESVTKKEEEVVHKESVIKKEEEVGSATEAQNKPGISSLIGEKRSPSEKKNDQVRVGTGVLAATVTTCSMPIREREKDRIYRQIEVGLCI